MNAERPGAIAPRVADRKLTQSNSKGHGTTRLIDQWRLALRDDDCELPALTRWVAYCVSAYMDFDTLGDAHPGQGRLARESGLSARAIRHHLDLLVVAGWLKVDRQGRLPRPGEKREASIYRGLLPTKERDVLVSATTKERGVHDYGTSRPRTKERDVPHPLSSPSQSPTVMAAVRERARRTNWRSAEAALKQYRMDGTLDTLEELHARFPFASATDLAQLPDKGHLFRQYIENERTAANA